MKFSGSTIILWYALRVPLMVRRKLLVGRLGCDDGITGNQYNIIVLLV